VSILVVAPAPLDDWLDALRDADPGLSVQVWPEASNLDGVTAVLAWKPQPDVLRSLPNLRLVMSMGAGVDHILSGGSLPAGVRLTRVVDDDLAAQMAQFVTFHVLRFHRGFDAFRAAQAARRWDPPPPADTGTFTVGLMGYGTLGRRCAAALRSLGFPVVGYRRNPGPPEDSPVFHSDERHAFLRATKALVCLLPLSPETRGIIDARTLAGLEPGAFLIAAGRGEQIVAEDVLGALDSGRLAGAALDVFPEEPLPDDSPFWDHPGVFVTPHCAADVQPRRAAGLLVENLRRLETGEPLIGEVDLSSGY
jgi:glyoxylate/hydroxypyruvate reductase